jgi:ubiquinone/menaquinone biosynthesis C-methylase UbiE
MSEADSRRFYDSEYHFAEDAARPDERRIWRAMKHLEPLEGTSFFDLGCGAGWATRLAQTRGRTRLAVGLDFSWTGLELARRHSPDGLWVQGDGTSLPLVDDCVDRLFCNGALEHFPDVKLGIAEIARVLRAGGRAVLIVPNFYVRTEQPMEFRATYWNWKKMLQASGLEIEKTAIDWGPAIFKNANLKRAIARLAGKVLCCIPFMQYQFVFVVSRRAEQNVDS